MTTLRTLTLLVISLLAGCRAGAVNPSSPLPVDEAKEALDAMVAAPRRFVRPVVIVGGYADPGIATKELADGLSAVLGHPENVDVTFPINHTFDGCRTTLADEITTRDAANAAPVGQTPIWVSAQPFRISHMAFQDPRINADIARRLRGEIPFATEPRSPLPAEDDGGG